MAGSYEHEIEAWRTARVAGLTGPEGWLSLIGLFWLEEGDNPIGSDPSASVVLPAGKAPAEAGRLVVEGGRATLIAQPEAGLTHRGRPVGTLDLRDDAAGRPTIVRLGPLSFHLIRREERLAVRVRDREQPARAGFRGIESYPVDPRWRVEAAFEPYESPRTIVVPTILDVGETHRVPGALAFQVEGTPCRLEAFQDSGGEDLFIVFADPTNEDETYGGGRYLYCRPPDRDRRVVVDFNKAYNPPCVFTPYATCPLPLPGNRLPVRILAGERRYPSG